MYSILCRRRLLLTTLRYFDELTTLETNASLMVPSKYSTATFQVYHKAQDQAPDAEGVHYDPPFWIET